MCLIMASERGIIPTRNYANVWANNSDGFGIAYAKDNKLHIKKTLIEADVAMLMDEAQGNPFVAHWRFTTHGHSNLSNCHPFKLSGNVQMAHNGILNLPIVNEQMSDTWHFVRMLQNIVKRDDTYFSQPFLAELGKEILGNKLAFIHSDGRIAIVNEKIGTWDVENDVWYSNDSSFWAHFDVEKTSTGHIYHFEGRNYNRNWDEDDEVGNTNKTIDYLNKVDNDGRMKDSCKTTDNGDDWFECDMCGNYFPLNQIFKIHNQYNLCEDCIDDYEEEAKITITADDIEPVDPREFTDDGTEPTALVKVEKEPLFVVNRAQEQEFTDYPKGV